MNAYDVIMFDYRGHGESSGVFYWTSREHFDLEKILDYARSKYSLLGIAAFSLGASVALNVLAHDPSVKSLVAISSASDPEKIDYKIWKLDIKGDLMYTFGKEGRVGRGVRPGPFWLKKEKPIDKVNKVKCPIFYIHGRKDWVIGYQHSQRLYEHTKSQKKIEIIENGTHAEYLLRDNPEVISLIHAWFKNTLK